MRQPSENLVGLKPRPMSNVTYLSTRPSGAPQPEGVAVLHCVAPLYFDPEPIKGVYARLPAHEADDMICRFLEDIALRLDQLQKGLAARDVAAMARPVRRVALAAHQMGLLEVAESAGHVRKCLTLNDGIALEATMARLERAFDLAVNEVWNLRDL